MMALDVNEEEMVASMVDTISGTKKLLPPAPNAPAPLKLIHATDALGEIQPNND